MFKYKSLAASHTTYRKKWLPRIPIEEHQYFNYSNSLSFITFKCFNLLVKFLFRTKKKKYMEDKQ